MIQLIRAGKRFGPKLLFEDVDWMITPQERVGLVGANGTGKSTLLKTLAGLESLDMGEFAVTKGITFGYLPQDGLRMTGRTVFDECLSVFESLHDMEREMETLSHSLAELDPASEEYLVAADRLHSIQDEFRNRDGYVLEAQVGTILAGLQFPKDDWSRKTEEFSGGWQMRIALAKLLLARPSILLLDEPTNHLDLEARNWLEDYLKSYPNAYILISHDRYFLDVTVNRIAEIWNKKITIYKTNYSGYLTQKSERMEQLRAAQRNQQERIEQLEAFINRFRYQATKAKQVQSRIKELEKIERIDLPADEKTIHFSFPQPKPSGRVVAEFDGVGKSYGPKRVFSGARFVIERGDRIALVGKNGAGKSTLIKLLAGSEKPTEGEFRLGHNAEVDYFAQDQYKALDPDARLLDDLWGMATRRTETEIRSILGSFLFSDEDVYKKIGVLSGGERNRYALARMLLQPSNLLLLDEPTNHLDMRAKDVLLESLEKFTGTVVFVSHDRYFIDKVATRVFEIEDGVVTVFPGNYEDYLWRKQQAAETPVAVGVSSPSAPAAVAAPAKPAKRVNPIKRKQMEDRVADLEKSIARLEAECVDLTTEMGRRPGEASRLAVDLGGLRQRISQLEAEWEAAAAELEAVQ